MAEDKQEKRAPPLVEVVLREDKAGSAGFGGLTRALRAGVSGALLVVAAATFALIGFLPWYHAPTADEVPKVCVDVIPTHIETALSNLGLAQLGAAAAGFIVFAAIGFAVGRRKAA